MPNRSFSDRLYRILLLLFPRHLRKEHGLDMEQLFRDRRHAVGRKPMALGWLWLQAIMDIGVHSVAERIRFLRGHGHSGSGRRVQTEGIPERMRSIVAVLKLSTRFFVRSPVNASIVVVTLALGIGAATSVFTLVDGVLIQPLPFPQPEELVSIRHTARNGQDHVSLSDGLYRMYREQAGSIDGIALYARDEMNLMVGDEAEQVEVQLATPSFFSVLGVQPALGRTFVQEEELPGSEPVVLLSHGFWERVYGSDAGVLGQVIEMDGMDRRVVGILPPDFGFPRRTTQAWVPYQVDPAQDGFTNFSANGLARLASGSTPESLNAEFQGLLSRIGESYPESRAAGFLAEINIRIESSPLKDDLVGDVGATLWVLLGTVGLVLLIACANVANLLLVRAESRRRELAVRFALGAGRGEIFRLFMGESVILAGAGGLLGLMIGDWALRIAIRFIPTDLPRVAEVGMDLRILAFTAALSLTCALFFGLFPLARYGSSKLTGSLKDGGQRGATSGRENHRVRNGLVVLQVAMALVLLVGSGLMFRSFQALQRVDPGFDHEDILTARISVPPGEIEGWQETAAFFQQLQARLGSQPGVEGVGLTRRVPLSGRVGFSTVNLEGRPRGPEEDYIVAFLTSASSGYFETMGIRLVEGRTFQSSDAADGAGYAIVSESFARRWWPNGSPIGHRLNGGSILGYDWRVVVGVVEDIRQEALDEEVEDMIYLPPIVGSLAEPSTMRTMDVVVKTTTPPLRFLPVLQRELRALDPRIPLANPRTMEDVFDGATARTSFTMAILGSSAAIALLIGLVGIYGVVSYVVSLRTREIGVRMALGATADSVSRMVLLQGLGLALAGVVLGILAAGMLSSLMSSLLFGIDALDPITYGGVALLLLAVASLAIWLPAHRAAAVPPSRSLRED